MLRSKTQNLIAFRIIGNLLKVICVFQHFHRGLFLRLLWAMICKSNGFHSVFYSMSFHKLSSSAEHTVRAPVQHSCPSVPVQGFLCHLPSLSPAPLCQDLMLGCSWHPQGTGHQDSASPWFEGCFQLCFADTSRQTPSFHFTCNLILFLNEFVLYLPVLEASYLGWLCLTHHIPCSSFLCC